MTNKKDIITFCSFSSVIVIMLYITSYYHYLLFHSLTEFLSITVAFATFSIIWNSREYIKSEYLQFVGIAYLFIGFLDLLHTLSYKGMNIFKDYDYYANQLWIGARYLESISLLIGFYILRNHISIKKEYLFMAFSLVTTALLGAIFIFKIFPVCFVDGSGLTPFKVISEYIICLILLLSVFFLMHYKATLEKNIYHYLMASIVLTIGSELCFTLYISNYGILNLIGHFLKIFSFYFIYKAIIVTGIKNPFELFFRDLHQSQIQLLEAKKAAESSNESKGTFLANMSHEIRTPLNAIIGFTSILEEEERDAAKKSQLRIILDSGNHLLTLVNEILDFSKIEAKKNELDNVYFSPVELCEKLKNMFIFSARQKGLILDTVYGNSLPFLVEADENKIRQILINLTGNAIKFTKKGSVTVQCGFSNDKLEFKVIDTGQGISPEKIDKIFLPFDQGDSSINREFGGTGLGLTISERLATFLGGILSVKSETGTGTEFTCIIPVSVIVESLISQNQVFPDGELLYQKWVISLADQEEIRDILPDGVGLFIQKMAEFRKLFVTAEYQDAKEVIHDIKGFTGNLRMNEVYEIAKIIDEELRMEKPDYKKVEFCASFLQKIADTLPHEKVEEFSEKTSSETISDYEILVVEDNVANQELVKTYLKKMNITCTIASDGIDGLKALENKTFDLIILDTHMPRMDGITFLKQFRKQWGAQCPVLMFTADVLKEHIDEYYLSGCTDIIPKPLKFETLRSKVHSLLIKSTPA